MASVKEFHEFADECMRWAAEARNEDQRQSFLQMACAWTQAALRLEGVLIPEDSPRLNGEASHE